MLAHMTGCLQTPELTCLEKPVVPLAAVPQRAGVVDFRSQTDKPSEGTRQIGVEIYAKGWTPTADLTDFPMLFGRSVRQFGRGW